MCLEFPRESPDALVLFVISPDVWEQEAANTTHSNTFPSPLAQLGETVADPDLCYHWPRVLSGSPTSHIHYHSSTVLVWREIIRPSPLSPTHWVFFRWYAGLQEVYRNVQAGSGWSWPHGSEWKKLIIEDRPLPFSSPRRSWSKKCLHKHQFSQQFSLMINILLLEFKF